MQIKGASLFMRATMRNHEMQDHQVSLDRMEGIHIRILMALHLIITLAHMVAIPTHIILMALHLLHQEVCLLQQEVCLLQPIMGCMDTTDLPLLCPLLLNTGVNTTLQSIPLIQ